MSYDGSVNTSVLHNFLSTKFFNNIKRMKIKLKRIRNFRFHNYYTWSIQSFSFKDSRVERNQFQVKLSKNNARIRKKFENKREEVRKPYIRLWNYCLEWLLRKWKSTKQGKRHWIFSWNNIIIWVLKTKALAMFWSIRSRKLSEWEQTHPELKP